MSLGIAFKGAEGVVLAADSRVTLTTVRPQNGATEILHSYFDNATKLLRLDGHPYVGAVTYGAGTIGRTNPRTAHSYLPEFESELANENNGRLAVEEFASSLSEFFLRQCNTAQLPYQNSPMNFFVGGYDDGAPYGRLFEFSVPHAPEPKEWHQGANAFGIVWGGQTEFTQRLITGYDPQLPFIVQDILGLTDSQKDQLRVQLKSRLEASIPFAFLPLQDCVDLSILLVRTTIGVQNWITGVRGVGGPIDVATITRTEGFKPVQNKSITGEGIGLQFPST